jgi:hypothetical protein
VAAEERHRIADAGAEVEHPRIERPARTRELGGDVLDLVFREILRRLAREPDVGRMQIAILGSEFVEFGFFHRGSISHRSR